MNIQEEKKNKKPYSRFQISFNDLIFNVKVQNAGKKPGIFNMLWFLVKSSWLLIVIFIFITTGTLNTLYYKFQNESASKVGTSPPKLYAHPWTQNFYMFFGMTVCCLIPHWIKEFFVEPVLKLVGKLLIQMGWAKKREVPKKGEEKEKLPKINQLLFMLPGICDAVASTILSVALIFTYASIYQMLQCVTVVFTFLLSILILKHNFHKFPHKWIGVFLVLFGSLLVGLNTVIYPQGAGKATARAPFFGACMVLIACLIYALFYIFEEWFLTGYDTDALQVPGYEGFWGIIIVIFVLFAIYWVPGTDYGSVESFPASIVQALHNPELLTWIILLTCNIGFYNLMGNVITLNISCATRAVLDQIRALLIWLIQMYRGRQEFTYLQLAGFIILMVGVAIYNEFMFNVLIPWYLRWEEKINKLDEKSGKGSFWWCMCDCYRCCRGCFGPDDETKGELLAEDETSEDEEKFRSLQGKMDAAAEKEDRSDDYEPTKKPTRDRDYSMDQKDFDNMGVENLDDNPIKI